MTATLLTGFMMQLQRFIFYLLLTLNLTHCVSYDASKRIVQQGNLLPETTVTRIKPGMSKQDITTVLGSSMITPLFSEDRWDYVYTKRKGRGKIATQRLSLYFSHNKLVKIED